MQHLEVSFAVRPIWWLLGVKWLSRSFEKVYTMMHGQKNIKLIVTCQNLTKNTKEFLVM